MIYAKKKFVKICSKIIFKCLLPNINTPEACAGYFFSRNYSQSKATNNTFYFI